MATQKPISTISYNTEAFLREKLDSWVEAHIIQAYMYICHKGEDGDKDHIHLRIEPNKRVDPMELSDALKEYQQGNDKPLGVRPWRPSKEEDWFLYAVHDKDYLKLKYAEGERGEKLEYKWEDIKASEGYDVETAYIRARQSLKHTGANLIKEIQNGKSSYSLVEEGENPFLVKGLLNILQVTDYERMVEALKDANQYIHDLKDAIDRAGYYLEEDEKGILYLIGKSE